MENLLLFDIVNQFSSHLHLVCGSVFDLQAVIEPLDSTIHAESHGFTLRQKIFKTFHSLFAKLVSEYSILRIFLLFTIPWIWRFFCIIYDLVNEKINMKLFLEGNTNVFSFRQIALACYSETKESSYSSNFIWPKITAACHSWQIGFVCLEDNISLKQIHDLKLYYHLWLRKYSHSLSLTFCLTLWSSRFSKNQYTLHQWISSLFGKKKWTPKSLNGNVWYFV